MTEQSQTQGGQPALRASLPMYDWPEIRAQTDVLWSLIRAGLRHCGLPAPDQLERTADPEPLWLDPDLVLSQTCGYPYANRLVGQVSLIGALARDANDTRPGYYRSRLVARKVSPPDGLHDLNCRRFAFNMAHSQSGFAAPLRLLASNRCHSAPPPLQTGSHRGSILAVARGSADWAAIDAVTWELARRHEPAAEELTVFATTPETPGLPLICSQKFAHRAGEIAGAVEQAIADLAPDIRETLMLDGLVRFASADYAPLAAPVPVAGTLPGMPLPDAPGGLAADSPSARSA